MLENEKFPFFFREYLILYLSSCGSESALKKLVSESSVEKFMRAMKDDCHEYAALRTVIRHWLYINFHLRTQKTRPSRDKLFFDAFQFIEASYCTTLVSHDGAFQKNFGGSLNPYIEKITGEEFIEWVGLSSA